jgi:hypothetical protein
MDKQVAELMFCLVVRELELFSYEILIKKDQHFLEDMTKRLPVLCLDVVPRGGLQVPDHLHVPDAEVFTPLLHLQQRHLLFTTRTEEEGYRTGRMQCCGSGSGSRCLFDPWIRDLVPF